MHVCMFVCRYVCMYVHSCLKILRLRRHENCLHFARARSRTLKTHTRICSSKIVLARASCCHCSFETFCTSNVARASFACTSNILHVQVVCTSKTFLNKQKMEGTILIATTAQQRIKNPVIQTSYSVLVSRFLQPHFIALYDCCFYFYFLVILPTIFPF